MANEDVRAALRQIEAQVNEVQRENARISAEIGVVAGAAGAAAGTLVAARNGINNTMNTGKNRLASADDLVLSAYELQGEISVLYERLKRMELANKEIRRLQGQRYYDFRNYQSVRKIVQGVTDNLDFSMVSPAMLDRAIEKTHLETPDYWLTFVLLAVVAWSADDRPRADRALAEALKLDRKRTASFLLILNLRLGRHEPSVKWFDELSSLELDGGDTSMVLLFFSLLSKTIEEEVPESSRRAVTMWVSELVDESLAKHGQTEEGLAGRILEIYRSLASDQSFAYRTLSGHITNLSELVLPLMFARNNDTITKYLTEILNVPAALTNEYLKQYVDEVVAAPCQVEAQLYDEIERNELIILHQGDADAAAADYEERKAHQQLPLDVGNELVRWVYSAAGAREVNPQIRRNMLVLMKQVQLTAAEWYVQQYQAMFPKTVNIAIEGFTHTAPLGSVRSAADAARAYCQAQAATERDALKDTVAYGLFGGAVVALLLIIAAPGAVALLVTLALGLAIAGGGYMLYQKKEREKVELKWEQKAHAMNSIVEGLVREVEEYTAEYEARDAESVHLMTLLASM